MSHLGDPSDPRVLRDALGRFCSGVTVVTGSVAGEPVGFTCQSFTSVSLDPPLVAITVQRTSTSWPRLRPTGRLVINVLADHQAALSSQFARRGGDRWAQVAWHAGRLGGPVLDECLLAVECVVAAEHDAGDHVLVLARVHTLHTPRTAADPLVFFRGDYRRLQAG